MDILKELEAYLEETGTGLEAMPRNSLADKGISGPTGAHVIEEIHTPFNFAYIAFTTGSTAFQNLCGVTAAEIPDRIAASSLALSRAGIVAGDHILFTYAPLVNVFPKQALEIYGLSWSFLKASSRDALLLALCKDRPRIVLGESSFLRSAIESATKMGMKDLLPKGITFIAAGTPLDPDFAQAAADIMQSRVHDLYGCQEFGWLCMDGVPLREDITLIETKKGSELIVGGLPTGDCFPVAAGKIQTHKRIRDNATLETTILASTAKGEDTVQRLARTILRIKARIVRISPDIQLGAKNTKLTIDKTIIEGPQKTKMLDTLLEAQISYQSTKKNDPTWIKGR